MTGINSRQTALILSNPFVNLILRLFVGGTLILSAVTKLPHHSQFVEIVKEYDLLPYSLATAYGHTLPWVELVIGVYLLLGVLRKYSAFATILMVVSFMVANISSIARGEHHCGACFGETISLPVWQAMAIDVLILIATLILLLARGGRPLLSLESLVTDRKSAEDIDRANVLEDQS